ncbi:MAG: hypothetical protein JRH20_03950 [Deltaproteobacteria bacterium]|nr:hypothetical protein [Deltaproteobacteria bacterium]
MHYLRSACVIGVVLIAATSSAQAQGDFLLRSFALGGLKSARNLREFSLVTNKRPLSNLPATHFALAGDRQLWNKTLQRFAAEVTVTPQHNGRKGAITKSQAQELVDQIRMHPKLGLGKLTNSQSIAHSGPCNARAFALGLEAKRWGLEGGALRNFWAAISGVNNAHFHHVALGIKAEEGRAAGGFWVIDAEHSKPLTLPQWMEQAAKRSQFGGKAPLFAVTEATRLDVLEPGSQSINKLLSMGEDTYRAAWDVHQQRVRNQGAYDYSLLPQ